MVADVPLKIHTHVWNDPSFQASDFQLVTFYFGSEMTAVTQILLTVLAS